MFADAKLVLDTIVNGFGDSSLLGVCGEADFIRQNSAAGHNAPLTLYVKAGGAIIDSNGFNIGALLPLLHDPALGGTPDGGLTKLGGGTLSLSTMCIGVGQGIAVALERI